MIFLGDCRDVPDVTGVDVMLTDPPYREHVHKSAVSQSAVRGVRVRDLRFGHLSPSLRSAVARFGAQVSKWSVIYSDVESATWWRLGLQASRATYIRTIPWVRWSMPQLSGDRPPSGCELLTVAWGSRSGKKSWNGPGNLTHLDHKCLRGEGKHKAEKPLDQLLDLVTWFSDPGDTVFDPFAGSGTTALACKLLGRDFVGWELDPEWADKANARVDAATLSERDAERFERWQASQVIRQKEADRIDANTAKIRARLDTAKGAA